MIFVFRIGSLGDSLVSLPALHHIKKRHPNEKIILITNDPKKNYLSTWEIVKYSNIFDDLMTYDGNQITSIVKLIIKIRKIKEKKMLYYLPPFRTAKQAKRDSFIFGILVGIDKTIGIDQAVTTFVSRNKKGDLFTLEKEYARLLRVVLDEDEKQKLEIFLPSAPLLIPTRENYKKIKNILFPAAENKTLIAIAHGTNMQAKKWELENFSELMKGLSKNYNDLIFIVVGGKEDFNEGEYLKQKIENCINLAGKLSIMESATLLAQCKLFIGNDTGTMHLASVMGTSTVGIFSARDNPGKWEPYGEDNIIIRKQVDCSGCMITECIVEKKKCLQMISSEEVRRKVCNYLSKQTNKLQGLK